MCVPPLKLVCASPTAYVTDASPPGKLAANLGIFQGVSVAAAFILGFPLSAVLAEKYGLRGPMYAAAIVGVIVTRTGFV